MAADPQAEAQSHGTPQLRRQPQAQSSPVPPTCRPSIRVSSTSSWDLTDLLEWLTELREAPYSLDARFTIKAVTPEQHRARCGGGPRASRTSRGSPVRSPPGPTLWGSYGGVTAQARLTKSPTISDWTAISSPSPLPAAVRGGLTFPTSHHLVGTAGSRPHPQES